MYERNIFVAFITTAIISAHTLMGIVLEPRLVKEGDGYYIRYLEPNNASSPTPSDRLQHRSTIAPIVDTFRNQVGIAASDICGYMQGNLFEDNESTGLIVCQSGKVFDNIITRSSSRTETPGWFLKGAPGNYVGQTIVFEGTRAGSSNSKKIIYFDRNQKDVGIPPTEYPQNNIQ